MSLTVDADRILQPLGVLVLRDSRYELLPGTREYTEEIPGSHGEFDFGVEYRGRVMELHCVLEVNPDQRADKLREIAGYLNALDGVQKLTFADDPGRAYYVRYAGKLDLNIYASWSEFTIPFKCYTPDGTKTSPFIYSALENELIGTGIATNAGNIETPFTVIITGPVTDPNITVGGYVMSYVGTIDAGSSLVIDTGKLTVTMDGNNALKNFNGVFPKLQPGDTSITAAAAGTTTIKWYDRWI